jgi:hypothetical protein
MEARCIMGSLFSPKKNKKLEESQLRQESLLARKEQEAERERSARRRSVQAAQAGRKRGLLSALEGSGQTRRLGGG